MDDIAVSVLVSGRVQGVWFRGWTQEKALALGLTGWVRNRADGRVEALIAGPEDRVAELIAALRDGPPAARVGSVEWTAAPVHDGEGFAIRR